MRLDIPYVSQEKNSTNCGACCLEMVYRYFGIEQTASAIHPRISKEDEITHRITDRTSLMIINGIENGLVSAAYHVTDVPNFLHACFSADIVPVILIRSSKTSDFGHFCVAVGLDTLRVYINDPDRRDGSGEGRKISLRDMKTYLSANSEICTENVILAFSRDSVPHAQYSRPKGSVLCHVCLQSCVNEILDPYEDRFFPMDYAYQQMAQY